MYIKKGVSIRGIKPEIVLALIMVSEVTYHDFVITGGTEDHPDRLPDSLHKTGLAVDIRVPDHEYDPLPFDITDDRLTWKMRVAERFNDTDFDLVWYDTHVHIEYDPK